MSSIPTRPANLLLRLLQALMLLLPGGLAQAQTLELVASIRPLALLAQDLTRGLPVTVNALLPANADPHSWALRISDRQLLERADLVLWLGPEFEGFLAKPLAEQGARQLRLDEIADLRWTQGAAAHHHQDQDHHPHHSGRDLHIWLNPANAALIQKALAARLAVMKPEWQAELQTRLQQQLEQLEQVQARILQQLAPHRDKGFIAYHDTYGHFVAAFGLRQLGAVNQSSEQRPSAKSLRELQTRAADAKCLMAEKGGAQEQRLAQTLQLPLVLADGLAGGLQLGGFAEFLLAVSTSFEACFSTDTEVSEP